ncbi:MAG: ABC transporter permease [Chloroflexi bacterium]|nr:ABC transporter permease [Chloroflexota bacterium]
MAVQDRASTIAAAAPAVVPRRRLPVAGYLLVAPGVLYLLGFLLIPALRMVGVSFWQFAPMRGPIPAFTFDNYAKLVTEPLYVTTILNTFRMGLVVTAITLALGYPLAYFLARTRSRYVGVYMFLVVSPLFVSVVTRSFGWMVVLAKYGPINGLLMTLGITQGPVEFLYTDFAVLVGLVHIFVAFMVLPIQSVLKGLDPSLELAAQNLGASRLRAFLEVTLPLSMPGVIAGSVLVFTIAISAFVIPALLGGISSKFLATLLFQQMMVIANYPFAATLGITMVVFTFTLLYVVYRVFGVKVW